MTNKKIRTILSFGLSFCVLILASCFFAKTAKAANGSLYLSPSSGEYTVGNTFSVQVKLNSGGVAINAADGTLVFSPDKLEVRSISKTDSIFSLWIQEPVFSNSLGTINFAGGKPTPGFTGAAGVIITITFKARTATIEPAKLTFAAGSILADDGKGTNILTSMGSGSYTLVARAITPLPSEEKEEEYVPSSLPGQAPLAPAVSSPTHPYENKWYSNNDPEFAWKLPSDVTGVSLLLHQNPGGDPGPTSDGLLESQKYENVEDGLWYFHVKFENESGWGAILHRKVLIDTKKPEAFEITVDNKGDATNPTPVLYFKTTDSLSGIDYYEIKIGEVQASTTQAGTKENPYQPPPVPAGKYTAEVKAFDKAGNFVSASLKLEISSIEPPKITKIPKSILLGEILAIEGTAVPEITVRIYIQKTEKEPILEKIKADSEGKFALSFQKTLTKGDYLVWAQAEDKRGALSYPTKKYELEVGLPPFLKFGKIVLDYLTTIVTLIILIVGAVAVIVYIWYRVSIWRKRVGKETRQVARAVTEAFGTLRKEVGEQIALLDKKPGLSKGEKEIRDKLKTALDISEKLISKEVKDVKKALEEL